MLQTLLQVAGRSVNWSNFYVGQFHHIVQNYKCIYLPPSKSLLGTYSTDRLGRVWNEICTKFFTAVLFMIAEEWKQSRCLPTGDYWKSCDASRLWIKMNHQKKEKKHTIIMKPFMHCFQRIPRYMKFKEIKVQGRLYKWLPFVWVKKANKPGTGKKYVQLFCV